MSIFTWVPSIFLFLFRSWSPALFTNLHLLVIHKAGMMDNCPLIRSDHLRYQNDNIFIGQNGSSRLSGSSSLSLTESGSSSTNGGRMTIPQFHINRNPTRNSNNNNNHPRISLFKALTRRRTESSSSKNGSKHKSKLEALSIIYIFIKDSHH